ncbi:MAG TPA: hypothetical protein VGD14_11335 [bacterium]
MIRSIDRITDHLMNDLGQETGGQAIFFELAHFFNLFASLRDVN